MNIEISSENRIKVWTRQHPDVAKALLKSGRHAVSDGRFIAADIPEHKNLVMLCYDWLSEHCPQGGSKPSDAKYPVWVALDRSMVYDDSNFTLLEFEIPQDQVIILNIAKWTRILDYRYIPADKTDEKRHLALLDAYGVSDAKAVMSNFYPDIKREVIASWDRLFDPEVRMVNDLSYGLVWELRREWLTDAAR